MSDPTANQQDPEHIAALRADAAVGREAPAQIADRDRTIALLRAGVDPDTRLGQVVAAELADDLSSEAVAAANAKVRAELGIPDPVTTPPVVPAEDPDAPGAAERALQATRTALEGGAAAPTLEPPPKGLTDRMADTFQEARKSGMPSDQAQEAAIGELFRAGAEGDPHAAYNEGAFQVEAAKIGHGQEYAGLPDARKR